MHQKIPNNFKDREELRNKGQFWTPPWVAKAMVEYVVNNSNLLFDPATGKGVFLEALREIESSGKHIEFYGIDIDENILDNSVYKDNFCTIETRDFISNPPENKFRSIVANPPYIRHHRLSKATKTKLKKISNSILNYSIDGRAGIHIYFLLQALKLLENNGKLAFIMPADTCEGVFANDLWNWIIRNYCLECVITFRPEATPFPKVDTNPIIFLIKKNYQQNKLLWIRVKEKFSDDLRNFIKSGMSLRNFNSLDIEEREIKEAISTGLSRSKVINNSNHKLVDFANTMRGIATGANKFFFITKEKAKELNIPNEFLKPAISRTRDVPNSIINKDTLIKLEKKNKPTLLFSPDGRALSDFPKEVQKYLIYGEKLGLNNRPLIKTRKPWYKMEKRKIPKFLFAYLGRRNARFIKNEAKVLPLTGFLCIYPKFDNKEYLENFWKILNHPETIKNLFLVGKSYGNGAIKVEPRALENLPIPDILIKKYNLEYVPIRKATQKNLTFRKG